MKRIVSPIVKQAPCITLLVALAAASAPTLTAFAQGWYTVDDFQYSPGQPAYATGLAKDPTGTIIYSAGYAADASGVGINHALAFKSNNGGTNWSVMDDYSGPAAAWYSGGMAADSAGNLYASGSEWLSSVVNPWFTRRSTDGGVTWSTVDALGPYSFTQPQAVAADGAGNVYVVGQVGTNGPPFTTWIVRKGVGGTNWATVAQSGPPTNNPAWTSYGVCCHPTAGVFVVGQGLVPVGKYQGQTAYSEVWTVRRSQDGGTTWTTIDQYLTAEGSMASSVGTDSAGNVYVVGQAWVPELKNKNLVYSHWIVRKSADGGNSWSTVDDFSPSSFGGGSLAATGFASDANGHVYVTGTWVVGGGVHWLVRESAGGTGSWQTTDNFQYVSGQGSQPAAVIVDNRGHAFVAGSGADASGERHWLARKR